MDRSRRAFTLVELLVVIAIVGIVGAVVAKAVSSAYAERGVQAGAQLVQAAIVSARDEAARTNAPRGIRFIPDATLPGTYSRIIPLAPGPDYDSGLVSMTDPGDIPAGSLPRPCLMVEQSPFDRDGHPAEPTSWFGNIRVGDKIRIGDRGPWMTVIGPMSDPPSDAIGPVAGTLDRGNGPIDYLWLTNGIDDDGDGFTDEADEVERWPFVVPPASRYTIRRQPVPSAPINTASLPAGAVVDATTADTTRERTRAPIRADGFIDVMFEPTGKMTTTPAMVDGGSLFFWIAARDDVHSPAADPSRWFRLPMPAGTPGYPAELPTLKRDAVIVAIDRSGRVSSSAPGDFDAPGLPTHYPPSVDCPNGCDTYIRADGPFFDLMHGSR